MIFEERMGGKERDRSEGKRDEMEELDTSLQFDSGFIQLLPSLSN
jgi:hypothetical protein